MNTLNDGIELAAKWVQKRLDDYDAEHGTTDPETGVREYPGRGAGADYVYELNDIVEGIRSLKKSVNPDTQAREALRESLGIIDESKVR